MDIYFNPIIVELTNMKIKFNTNSTSEHVTEIELHIHIIKDIARVCSHTTPFKKILKVILVNMLMNSAL